MFISSSFPQEFRVPSKAKIASSVPETLNGADIASVTQYPLSLFYSSQNFQFLSGYMLSQKKKIHMPTALAVSYNKVTKFGHGMEVEALMQI